MFLLLIQAATRPLVKQGYHLSHCPNFRGRLYLRWCRAGWLQQDAFVFYPGFVGQYIGEPNGVVDVGRSNEVLTSLVTVFMGGKGNG